jgi:hypothetical protein
MQKAIDRLFQRLSATYGAAWDRSLGETPLSDIKTIWAHELSAFEGSLHRVAWALENLPERCPNVIEFRNLCRNAPSPVVEMRLDTPKADPQRVAQELAKLSTMKNATTESAYDPRSWAKAILRNHKGGIKQNPTALQMAKDAVREAA